MVTYIGLYYPFIHFRDEGWLKLTALYWDGMRRIVPGGASVHDSDEVKRLVRDASAGPVAHSGRAGGTSCELAQSVSLGKANIELRRGGEIA